jgi:sugar O-acyltransferase (sialic acid O-acetyltransferase NeuD family)
MFMAEEIIIVGSGAHARVVFDILRAAGRSASVGAFVDVEGKGEAPESIEGVRVMHGLEAMHEYVRSHEVTAILGHGNNSRRKSVLPHLEGLGVKLGTAIHPSAVISPGVEIGGATTISAGVVIITGAKIGKGVIVNTCASIDHDCVIEDFVQIAPGAHLAGKVKVETEAFVGIGAVVIQNLTIGRASVIGAGAAVVRDVPPESLVIGVPARVRKHL